MANGPPRTAKIPPSLPFSKGDDLFPLRRGGGGEIKEGTFRTNLTDWPKLHCASLLDSEKTL